MEQLRIPGPTPCPPEVLQAMTRQMINHRGEEYGRLQDEVIGALKKIFQTKNDVLLLTGAGTGGMEAAVVNMLSPGDTVLAVSIGVFGERFAAIARTFGAEVIPLDFEQGKPADPDAVRRALRDYPRVKAVLVTHNETSTGVTNDLKSLSAAVKEFDKLLMVDAVSSLGSINLPVDDWHCDVAISGSQKGWMVPPGMAFVSVSPEGWRAHQQAKMPRFYWDFTKAKNNAEKKQTPWTPAVSVVYALATSLKMMLAEGIDNIFARHARVTRIARDGVRSLGLPLLAADGCASHTVTAVGPFNGPDVGKLLKIMLAEHQTVLASGQGKLAGKIFRIGHLGWVHEDDIRQVLASLEAALPKAGFRA